MPSDTVLRALAAARFSLAGADEIPVIRRRDGAEPVAFLVSLGRREGDVVLPLQAGLDFVGYEASLTVHAWPDGRGPRLAEGAQWYLSCEGGSAAVADARSTNGSTLERAEGSLRLPTPAWRPEFLARMHDAGWLSRGEGRLPPGMRVRADGLVLAWQDLAEGDLLRGCYATFAFGWCRDPRPA